MDKESSTNFMMDSIKAAEDTDDPEGEDIGEANNEDSIVNPVRQRGKWSKGIEFLFSCIAMSVGLGNIWRFPLVALKNGGGAFLIPYLIVLFLVGRPIYFMEMVIGQFSSRGTIKIYDFAPGMRGVGVGQVISTFTVSTFYASILALTLRYLISSFSAVLPWAYCDEKWGNISCSSSALIKSTNETSNSSSTPSAALFLGLEVTQGKDSIDDGLGTPNLYLVGLLVFSWTLVFFIMIKGIRSSGKASYVLAIFPYIILSILLGRAVTLPGAWDGIMFFLTPNFSKMLEYEVWFNAATQVFFSLNICFGCVSMYSSYNKFNHNLYRDVNIISLLDTCTSILAGCITFGILGHIKHKTGENVFENTKAGAGLAFVTYPDALAKFEFMPPLFSVLFFLMLYTLGIGSIISMISCVMTVVRDKFPKVKNWQAALIGAVMGCSVGITYLTPGGLNVLTLVDFFGAQCVAFVFAIAELIAVFYIYGTERFCKDIEFMLGFRPGFYWRACWKIVTPFVMISILIFTLIKFELPNADNGKPFPTSAYVFGWSLTTLCLIQFPIFAFVSIVKQKGSKFMEQVKKAFQPLNNWGPQDPKISINYNNYLNDTIHQEEPFWQKIPIPCLKSSYDFN